MDVKVKLDWPRTLVVVPRSGDLCVFIASWPRFGGGILPIPAALENWRWKYAFQKQIAERAALGTFGDPLG